MYVGAFMFKRTLVRYTQKLKWKTETEMDTQNERGDIFIRFFEKNKLLIMNIFFDRKASKEWMWNCPNGEPENQIYFILTNKLNIVRSVTILNKLSQMVTAC